MRSFYGQYGRNKFPIYSRVRTDDNSVGARLFDEMGNALQNSLTDAIKSKKQLKALEDLPVFEFGEVYRANLFSNDKYLEFLNAYNLSSNKSFFIEVKDSLDNELIGLDFDYHNQSIPTSFELELKKSNVLNSRIELIDTLDKIFSMDKHLGEEGHHIWIYIPKEYMDLNEEKKGITFDSSETTYRFKSNNIEGNYFVVIRGIDIADNYIEESIRIDTDTLYRTKTKFKYICDVVKDIDRNIVGGPAFERIGFESRIKCWIYPKELDYIPFDYFELVSPYSKRINGANQLTENEVFNFYSKMYLKLNYDEENDINYLGYYFCGLSNLTLNQSEKFTESELMVLMFEQKMDYDKTEGEKLVRVWPDYKINKLVAVSNLGNLYYFEVGKNEFNSPLLPRTKNTTLELESISQHEKFGNEIDLKIFNRNYGYEIDNLIIIRNKPSNRNVASDLVFEFLQADYTWSNSLFIHERDVRSLAPNRLEDLKLESFLQSIRIPVTLNEEGQWDFYILSFANDNYNFKDAIQNKTPSTLYDFILSKISNIEVYNLDNPVNSNFELNYYSIFVEFTSSYVKYDLNEELLQLLNVNNLNQKNVNFYIDFVENNYIFYIEGLDSATCVYAKPIYNYYNTYSINDANFILYRNLDNIKIRFFMNIYDTGVMNYTPVKMLNFTSIDEVGYSFNLFRDKEETLNDYYYRVYKATQFVLPKERDYFQKCLGFISSIQDKNVFQLKLIDPERYIRLRMSCSKIYVSEIIWNGNVDTEEIIDSIEINEVKFLIDFKLYLMSLTDANGDLLFEVIDLQDNEDWFYLKTRNLLQIDTRNVRLNFTLNNAPSYIPENNIKRLISKDGTIYQENTNLDDKPENDSEYLFENRIVFKSTSTRQNCRYEYSMFPVTFKWLPFRWAAFNDDDFDLLVKDKCYYDNTEELKPKILNQNGALLYNMVLKKHNIYWGDTK